MCVKMLFPLLSALLVLSPLPTPPGLAEARREECPEMVLLLQAKPPKLRKQHEESQSSHIGGSSDAAVEETAGPAVEKRNKMPLPLLHLRGLLRPAIQKIDRMRTHIEGMLPGNVGLPWAFAILFASTLAFCWVYFSSYRPRKSAPEGKEAEEPEAPEAKEAVEESAEVKWLNNLVSLLWPKLDTYIQELMTTIVQPMVNKALPRAVRGTVAFGEVTLGDARPQFGPINVRQRSSDTVMLDLGVNMDLGVVFALRALGMSLYVRRILLKGVVTVVFRRLQATPPFFGGLEVYFANSPELHLDFGGLAEVAEYPGLRGIVRGAIMDLVHRFLVLPARFSVNLGLDNEDDVAELRFPAPLGVLRLSPQFVSNLSIANGCCYARAPTDLYVVVKINQDYWTSSIGNGREQDFLIYDQEQLCDITVLSANMMCKDAIVGEVIGIPLRKFAPDGKAAKNTFQLRQHGKITGSLQVASQWLTLSSSEPESGRVAGPVGGPSQFLLLAKISGVTGMPNESRPPFTVRFTSGGYFEASTRASYPKRGGMRIKRFKQVMCEQMGKLGMSAENIGEILELWPELVSKILEVQDETDEERQERLAKWRKSVNKERAVHCPEWNETLRLLVPWNQKLLEEPVTLELRDCHGAQVGNRIEIPLENILRGDGAELEGPFKFSETVSVNATFRVRWLKES